jgi:hypothetical protein
MAAARVLTVRNTVRVCTVQAQHVRRRTEFVFFAAISTGLRTQIIGRIRVVPKQFTAPFVPVVTCCS